MEGERQQIIGWVTARDNNKNPIYLEVVEFSPPQQPVPPVQPAPPVQPTSQALQLPPDEENDDDIEALYGPSELV